MYKILDSNGLGVSGRQNELIELALTHNYNGVEVDMADLVGRHDTLGKNFACQFLMSANIDMGTFGLPVDLGADDAEYAKFTAKLDTIADLASTLGAKRCYVRIQPSSDVAAFQENFERHRSRLFDIAEKFKAHEIRIGLYLEAVKAQSSEGQHKFVQTAEEILTLVKTVGHDHVGLCLDTLEWQAGDGAMDQLSELDKSMFVEVRLSDISESADHKAIAPGDRKLPGDTEGSLAIKLMEHLRGAGFEGPVSIGTNMTTFGNVPRDKVVAKISQRLDQIIAGEPVGVSVVEVEETEGEAAEGEESPAVAVGNDA